MSDITSDEETKLIYGLIETKVISSLHEFYISGNIGPPEEYVRTFNTIRHAAEDDTIKVYINSFGGDLYTAIQFMRVFAETKAHVICSIEGACLSAATIIFLNADSFEITPHSSFMIHNYSGGTMGKGAEMLDQLTHERKWSEALFAQVYKDFLTPEEIRDILLGKDLWMDVDQVVDRMNKRIETREEQNGL
ncbi:MAG: ATP-dependent Clp protease proteolytic subunit [Methylococcales bacterium]